MNTVSPPGLAGLSSAGAAPALAPRSPPLSLDLAEVPLLLLVTTPLSNSSGESPLNDGTAASRQPWLPQGSQRSAGHRSPGQGGPAGPPAPRHAQRGWRLPALRPRRPPPPLTKSRPALARPRPPVLPPPGPATHHGRRGPGRLAHSHGSPRSRPGRRPPSGPAAAAPPPGPGPPERPARSCCPAVPPTLARGR